MTSFKQKDLKYNFNPNKATSSPAHLFAIAGRRKSEKLLWGRGCLKKLGFLKIVFPGGGEVNLSPTSYFKKNLSNLNITLYNC